MTHHGGATAEGTNRFSARFPGAAPGHFRLGQGWWVSSLGLGTYLGQDDAQTDRGYAAAIARTLELGCNALDTAINYRNQRSERVVGETLARLVREGRVARDEVVVATKGGFIPFESGYPGGMRRYVEETFLRPGILTAGDVVAGCHCMSPTYLRHQVASSRRHLDGAIDIYYLHNPETQLQEIDRDLFASRVRAAFQALEEAVAQGWIGLYGTATWTGYRVDAATPDYVSLEELVGLAVEVAGESHHFRAIQLPFNLAMTEAFALANQPSRAGRVPLLRAAQELGLTVMASASLLQSRLTRNLPPELHAALNGGIGTDAQRALQFVRSTPGLTTALVGMSTPAHVTENLALVGIPPLPEERFRGLFG